MIIYHLGIYALKIFIVKNCYLLFSNARKKGWN